MKDQTGSLFGGDDDAEDLRGGGVVQVAFEAGVDTVFSYILPISLGDVVVGQRVEVPFGRGNKPQVGFVVGMEEQPQQGKKKFKLKAVRKIVDAQPLLDDQLIKLAQWISSYYVCPLGQVLSAMLPSAVKKGVGVKKKTYVYLSDDLSDEIKLTSKKQKAIVESLKADGANDANTGVEKADLLDHCDCTASPLKKLVHAGIVKIITRQVLPSLPAVPAEFLNRAADQITLNSEQVTALNQITAAVKSDSFGVTLLYGVTDSGKTEVYIRAIQNVVEDGKSAIVLLPEIALTTQTVNRFKKRFERVAVMHSGLSSTQRNAQWQAIRSGDADVVIGARSAVFAPLSNLGLIVVDEEHEPSYKQDTVPRYNGRDVAIVRANMAKAHCLLGTATPSLETLHNCRTKKHFHIAELTRRVNDLPMPQMKLVDMSYVHQKADGGVTLLSPELEKLLTETIERGEQVILLLNRRGYSNFVYCPSCRHTIHCKNCDVTLTFHKKPKANTGKETILGKHMGHGFAICHYCMSKTLVPQQCPLCGKGMTMIGLGSQRLEEELARKLPNARVKRVDSDAMAGADAAGYYNVLRDFAKGDIDVLAGTQILAKGLHFPNVTLVGVISADTSLSLPDFRANERTFQLISQVAGRAGRSEKPGTVIVQTYLPDSPAIKFAMAHDYTGFVKEELSHRSQCALPPFGRMAIVGLRSEKYDRLTEACNAMRWRIDTIIEEMGLDLKVRGPMEATIARIQRFHRMQIIIQAKNPEILSKLFARLRSMPPIKPSVRVSIDVDPINLL